MVEYRETYKKEVDPASLGYVMKEISSVYKSESGWELGDPVMTPNPDGKVTLEVELTKMAEPAVKTYKDIFVKQNVQPESIAYVLDQIQSVYKDWEVSDPTFIQNSNGTVTIAVPLSKRGDEYTPQRRF